jgi:DNA gyrase subunit A
MGGDQKLKEGDCLLIAKESSNSADLLFFTNKCQVYKARAADFEDSKASVLGDFVATKLGMDSGETAIYMAVTADYSGYMLFLFENGKAAKVEMESYKTKTNRKKLINAFSSKFPVAAIRQIDKDCDLVIKSSAGRLLLFNSGSIAPKTTKDTQGINVMTLKKGQIVIGVREYIEGEFAKPYRYKTKNLPAAGATLSAEDAGEQLAIGSE